MSEIESEHTFRPVRVPFPARVEFAGEMFLIKEFSANLSVGGIFLPTEHQVAPGTRGSLTFRISQWEDPFTVQAEVVRAVPQGEEQQPGLGIRFIELSDLHRQKLERLVEGMCDGSVVEAIRRGLREGGRTLEQELRRRPLDQKLILALHANMQEIDALIRDARSEVLVRLLDNPRVTIPQARAMLRNTTLSTGLLLAVKRRRKWMSDEEVRYLFCKHPNTPVREVMAQLPTLTRPTLQQLIADGNLRKEIRNKAQELQRSPRAGG